MGQGYSTKFPMNSCCIIGGIPDLLVDAFFLFVQSSAAEALRHTGMRRDAIDKSDRAPASAIRPPCGAMPSRDRPGRFRVT